MDPKINSSWTRKAPAQNSKSWDKKLIFAPEVSKDTSVIVPFRKITYYVWGCTDINACNHNTDATKDDGSCEYDPSQCNDNSNISPTYTCKNTPSSTWLNNPNVNVIIENNYTTRIGAHGMKCLCEYQF